MSECTICGSEEYDPIKRLCPDCGDYDESLAHGTEARRRKEELREIEERYR